MLPAAAVGGEMRLKVAHIDTGPAPSPAAQVLLHEGSSFHSTPAGRSATPPKQLLLLQDWCDFKAAPAGMTLSRLTP